MLPVKKFFLIWFSALTLFSFACATARADGFLPSHYTTDVYMPEQLAIVYFKDGREDLIIQVQYKRNDIGEFGWIIPLPYVPEIDTESENLAGIFWELSGLTTDELPTFHPWEGGSGGGPPGDGGVIVIQEEQVGIYEVIVLEANTAEDLVAWLNDKNYAVPEGSEPVFQDYIDLGWCFVCMKLEPSEDLFGYLHPLRLSFPFDPPVYPMKLTEFSSGLTELLMYVIAEDEQTFSKASKEWGYYVPKATLSYRYPLLDRLVDGNVFITKLRRVYTHGEDTYDDITLMKAETRIQVEVWPYSGKVTKGYRHVFRARGGKPPYSWSCNNDSVGEIDSETGEFAAVGLGTCNVIAADAEGITGSSGTITVGEEDEPNPLDDDGGAGFSSCAMSSSVRNVGDIAVLMMSMLVIRLIFRRKMRSR